MDLHGIVDEFPHHGSTATATSLLGRRVDAADLRTRRVDGSEARDRQEPVRVEISPKATRLGVLFEATPSLVERTNIGHACFDHERGLERLPLPEILGDEGAGAWIQARCARSREVERVEPFARMKSFEDASLGFELLPSGACRFPFPD